MEQEGSSRGTEEKERRQSVEGGHSERRRVEHETAGVLRRPKKNEDDLPEDSDDEDNRARIAGSRVFPPTLWNRLNNPVPERAVIDFWEFKIEGDVFTMTLVVDGEKYPMYFTSRSPNEYNLRANYWIPRHNQMYKALRCRLISMPKVLSINKLVFYNTPDCEAEDCLIELMFIKKWTCKALDYNVVTEFSQPQHLRKLITMFKPTEILISLNYGPYIYNQQSHDQHMQHNHISTNFDTTLNLEKDFRHECQELMNSDKPRVELTNFYGEAGKARSFGNQMLRTLCSIRKIVSLIAEGVGKPKVRNWPTIRKLNVNGPAGPGSDKPCSKLAQLLKDEGVEDSGKKRQLYASGERMYVCVRSDLRRAQKYSLGMPASSFKMDIGNDQFLNLTKAIPIFHCLFRTSIDADGVRRFVEEWQKGERSFEEIQVHIDKVIDHSFIDYLGADHNSDSKKIKIRRTIGGRRQTLSIEKDRLTTRHLSLRFNDEKSK
ncbi:hypothetical protein CAEBREN_06437 [Caenorhabditis brenneri]|uniref:Uncharacterized protein n=1 Tax=Caenorhabditis brenneri TaxID=135651 RepID=G0MZX0_CAEBE|nr:hypothetical protein CAEBREN_06437 [Caenorhabditis brenneri]